MPDVMTQLIDSLNKQAAPASPKTKEYRMIVTMGTFTKKCTTNCPSIQDLVTHCQEKKMHPAALFFSPDFKDALHGKCVEFTIRLYDGDNMIGEHIDTIR